MAADSQGTPLDAERYISLETFRRDGTGVKTPVWAAPLDGRLVVVTDGTSFKVKRLRANPKFKAAPCDARGKVKSSTWYDGTARILQDDAEKQKAIAALRQKYGWQIRLLDVFSFLGGRIGRRAYLELAIPKQPVSRPGSRPGSGWRSGARDRAARAAPGT